MSVQLRDTISCVQSRPKGVSLHRCNLTERRAPQQLRRGPADVRTLLQGGVLPEESVFHVRYPCVCHASACADRSVMYVSPPSRLRRRLVALILVVLAGLMPVITSGGT